MADGRHLLITLLLLAAASMASAQTADDAVLDARARALASELRCLVCRNETLAESSAALAQDLRAELRRLLAEGRSDAEVRAFFSERYGDVVHYRPPLQRSTLALWFGPAALLGAGLLVLWLTLRRRQRLPAEAFEPEADDVEANDREEVSR
ncbi:cytochrome c-type biogenesis protein [Caldimonas caldifontis]|uniref:Cytochrome c-type biogenesis protein n=1 Tax=Caldimonas caldifontis TaxID=1452508 RepID=A0A2S5SXW3_9BURK|nr:cytochrome c-type biogenesis protein [Caldimonas caldifontis]PPE67469.1 cytochrome c-type biogenesis protein CcmH [Caldimonas caldifontis]